MNSWLPPTSPLWPSPASGPASARPTVSSPTTSNAPPHAEADVPQNSQEATMSRSAASSAGHLAAMPPISDVQRNAWLRQMLGLPNELHTLLASWPEAALKSQLNALNAGIPSEILAKQLLALLDTGRQKLQSVINTPGGGWNTPGNVSAGKTATDLLQQLTQFSVQLRQNPAMASQILTLIAIPWQPAAPLQQVRVNIPSPEGDHAGEDPENRSEKTHAVQVYLETPTFGRLRFVLQEASTPATPSETSWQLMGHGTLSEESQQAIQTALNPRWPKAIGQPQWFWMCEKGKTLKTDDDEASSRPTPQASPSAAIVPSGQATPRLLSAATTLVSGILAMDNSLR